MNEKTKFYVVWHSKDHPEIEGVIFESEEDAMVAAGKIRMNPCCTLADDFYQMNDENTLEITEVYLTSAQAIVEAS